MKIVQIALALIFIALLPGCATYSVEEELEKEAALAKLKDIGLVMRISSRSPISLDEHNKNFSHWLSGGVKQLKKISVISDVNEKIAIYNNETDSFYQQKSDDSYLRYKSIGVINVFLRNNVTELKSLITSNQLDGLVIYQVYSILSTDLQFMDFYSVLLVVDRNLNLLYMDHQSDDYDTTEIVAEKIRNDLLNSISERLVEQLMYLDFLSEE